MDLIIVGGAGTLPSFYEKTREVFLARFDDVKVVTASSDSLEEATRLLAVQLNEIKEDFILLGHSYGGFISINYLGSDNPINPHLKGFVLCNSLHTFNHVTPEIMENAHEDKGYYVEHHPGMEHIYEHTMGDIVRNAQMAIAMKYNLEPQLLSIPQSIPVLILGSDGDGYIHTSLFLEEFNKLLLTHNSTYSIIIHEARHLGIITHAKQYLEAVCNFIHSAQLN